MIRRLTRQQAPADAVLAAAAPYLKEEEQQSVLVEALGLGIDGWPSLPQAYRCKLLKAILAAIPSNVEVDERLLEFYLQPSPDESDGWSTSTYDISAALPPLHLSVFSGIGGGNETGGRVWPAALALGAYLLARHRGDALATEHRRPRVALELGAGPGLPGLLLANVAASEEGTSIFGGGIERVVLTDIVPTTLDNLWHNTTTLAPLTSRTLRCTVAALDWYQPPAQTAAAHADVDLILAADCVYDPDIVEPLLATLGALLQPAPPPPPSSDSGQSSAAETGPLPPPRVPPIALVAVERRGAAWERFEMGLSAEVASGRMLVAADRSDAARCALREAGCPFYCAPDAIERIVLLELTGGPAAPRRSASP
mmetsp:Transcript_30311/g.98904  ORF Transcript_30311/g.98904 Transcript_30311/m.98904 type:complete len:369 (-) Transcript_30311:73-1179(-)